MALELYVKQAGQGPAVLLLHGLFGAGGNLGALSRSLQDAFTVYSIDLPNHGRSAWLAAPDLPAMADSLQHWMGEQGIPHAHLIGHSLGGKVAMQLALQSPASVVSVVVADISPVSYAGHHDAVFAALEAVAAARCATRAAAAELMAQHLEEEGVIQFLLMSLRRDDAGFFDWRFDLQGLKAAYPALLASPTAAAAYEGPVLFIKGGDSDYIREQYWPETLAMFPAASLKVVPACGHWLHVEKPQLFNRIVGRFLAGQPGQGESA
jgi:esterase